MRHIILTKIIAPPLPVILAFVNSGTLEAFTTIFLLVFLSKVYFMFKPIYVRHLSVQAPVFAIGLVLVEASGFINGCVICCLDQEMSCSCMNLAKIRGGDPYISTVTI